MNTAPSPLRAWTGVIALSLAAFIFNTTEFIPVGLLTDIGNSFAMPVEQVGLMLTIYAWCVALASLPMLLAVRNVERRKLLLWLFVVFIASHILSGFAWNFTVLMISRIGIALSHAVFWSITGALAVRIAPRGKQSQALGMLAASTSLAMIFGIPIGRMVSELLDWRTAFFGIGAFAAITMAVLARALPHLPSQNAGSLASLPILFRRPALVAMYVLIVLIVTANFTAYSYVEPFIQVIGGLSASTTTITLLVFGAAGVFGSVLFGRLNPRIPRAFMLSVIGVLGLCLLLLRPSLADAGWLYSIAVLWGICFVGYTLAIQYNIMGLAPDARDVAMSMFSGLYNVGIGAGALIGSQVSIHAGMTYVGYVGGVIALVALAWCAFALRRYHRAFAEMVRP